MNIDKLLELFNPLPGNHYLYVSNTEDEISSVLSKLLDGVDGELNLALYNEQNLALNQPFRAIPRDNDMVIIKDVFSQHENKNMLLKLAYLTLANTANVIILEKKGLLNIQEIKDMLEKHEYRAANDIDVVEGYDLIIAKKMHMWGNGL